MPNNSVFRIAWIGPSASQCDHVLDRFVETCGQLNWEPDIVRMEEMDAERLQDCLRLVFASVDRSDYPVKAIEELVTTAGIVPWGVVTNSWHIGSRRSGHGPITHWQQPWFRWWDSWFGWFFPEVARTGGLVTNAFSPMVTYGDFATPGNTGEQLSSGRQLAVLCGCPRTAELLQLQAEHVGWQASVFTTLRGFQESDQTYEITLWDDSLLPCLPGGNLAELLDEQFSQLTSAKLRGRLVASIDMVHLHLWPSLQSYGCRDVLVKPSHGLPLSNLLFHLHHLPSSAVEHL